MQEKLDSNTYNLALLFYENAILAVYSTIVFRFNSFVKRIVST